MKSVWNGLARTDRADLRRLQDERLVQHVRERLYPFSAHYRRVFDAAGVKPTDIRGVADLARLPFTMKADLLAAQSDPARKRDFVLVPSPELIREHWPLAKKLRLLAGGGEARERLRRDYTPNFVTFTTGRSADPIVFAYTPYDIQILAEVGARMFDVHGIQDPLARIVNMFPFAPHLAFWQATWAGFETGCMMLSTGGGKVMGTAGNLRILERVQPTVLIGTPGFVYHLLREGAELKTKLDQVALVILGAEKVTPGLKEKMGEALARMGSRKVTISGTYGFTEARMAFSECPASHAESPGYHVYPDLGVFEVVDPVSGAVLGEGETGELVYTPIDGHGTVVCRYRTGDLAVGGITWEPCPWCKRTVPRIASELRRVSDQRSMSLTKIKGTLVDLSSMGSVLSNTPEIEEWQVVLQKKNDDPHELDELIVRLSVRSGTDRAACEKKVRQELLIGVEIAPNVVEFKTTPEMLEVLGMETEMKEKRFLDRRPK
ncbi:MAG: AMP-binding protein [Planctomycetota bacterium]|nr:AMP-binding protein [Planctomycetota bacterium]